MSKNVTIPEGKFFELSSNTDIVNRVRVFGQELLTRLHESDEELTLVNLKEIIIRLDCAIAGRPVNPEELPGYEWPHDREDCDDRWTVGCDECDAIERQKVTDSPCADGDFCKRVDGRIVHDRFCNNINHKDED